MSDIVYSDKNLIDNKVEGVVIEAGSSIKLYLSKEDIKSGCRWLKYVIFYEDVDNSRSEVVCKVDIKYEGVEVKDKYLVVLNDDGEEGAYKYNIAELKLQGRSISSVELSISNRGKRAFKIRGMGLYTSKDVDVNQLTDALEVDVISADNAMSLSAWIDNLQVNQLETNIVAKSVFEGFLLKRDFIKINDRTIDFATEELSEVEEEHLHIEVGGELRGVYYTAIGDHKDAYKYLTINHPSVYRPELSPSECDRFRYMVRRSLSRGSGLKLHFIDEEVEGVKVSNPVIDFGVAQGSDRSGCGRIIRGREGLRISYVDKEGREHYIEFNNNLGVIVNGGNKLEGMEIGESYFRADYSHYSVRFSIEKDEEGRIVSLTDDKGFVVPIVYSRV